MDFFAPLAVDAITNGALIVAGVIAIAFLGWIALQLVRRTREAAEVTEATPGLTADPPTVTGQPRAPRDREARR